MVGFGMKKRNEM